MENWGLITYREQTLLYDPVDSSEVDKQIVARVVTHELGHMVIMIILKKKIIWYHYIIFVIITFEGLIHLL